MKADILEDFERAEENEFAHKLEFHFRTEVLALRYFSLWAAMQLGFKFSSCKNYALSVEGVYLRRGPAEALGYIRSCFAERGIQAADNDLMATFRRCLAKAVRIIKA